MEIKGMKKRVDDLGENLYSQANARALRLERGN